MLLNNEWVKNGVREEIKKFLETNENELDNPNLMGNSKGSPEREVHSETGLPKKNKTQKPNKQKKHLK